MQARERKEQNLKEMKLRTASSLKEIKKMVETQNYHEKK